MTTDNNHTPIENLDEILQTLRKLPPEINKKYFQVENIKIN